MMLAAVFLVALVTHVHGGFFNSIHGIAYIQETVADLDKSIRFYTEVFDGMLIEEFRVRGLQSDEDYYKMFQKEILDARAQNVPPENVSVPEIKAGGTHVVNWDFVLFDNSLIWLVQFTDLVGNLFNQFDPNVGSAKTGYGHLAFWANKCVNPYQMLQAIYDGEVAIGSSTAGLTTSTAQTSFSTRNAAIQQDITQALPAESNGFRFGATRGPNGEKVEISFRRGIGTTSTFQDFCGVLAVHSAMLTDQCPKLTSKYSQPLVKTNGFHHVSMTIPNTTEAVDFYTTVIGGESAEIAPNLQFPEGFRNMIVQDDLLSAAESNLVADAEFGFVDINLGDPNSGTIDTTFINFDNFYLELYAFTPANPADKAKLERSWTSPAYLNTVTTGFWVKETVTLASYIKNVESTAAAKGYSNVKANRAVNVNTLGDPVADADYSSPFTAGNLEGFDYVFAKGPADETISFAQFAGTAGKILEQKYKIYGGVSVAYPETNPYNWGGYEGICLKPKALG